MDHEEIKAYSISFKEVNTGYFKVHTKHIWDAKFWSSVLRSLALWAIKQRTLFTSQFYKD